MDRFEDRSSVINRFQNVSLNISARKLTQSVPI